MIIKVHHIAIICSNYEASKTFYTQTLGLTVIAETYRSERQSFKLDLAIGNTYCIELFSFPSRLKESAGRKPPDYVTLLLKWMT